MKISITDYVKYLEENPEITYDTLAKQTGVSSTTIKYVLQKERTISKKTFEAFKTHCDIEFTDYLVENEIKKLPEKLLDQEKLQILEMRTQEENQEIDEEIRALMEKKKRNLLEVERKKKLRLKYEDFNEKLDKIVEDKDSVFDDDKAYNMFMKLFDYISGNLKTKKVVAHVNSEEQTKQIETQVAEENVEEENFTEMQTDDEGKVILEEIPLDNEPLYNQTAVEPQMYVEEQIEYVESEPQYEPEYQDNEYDGILDDYSTPDEYDDDELSSF